MDDAFAALGHPLSGANHLGLATKELLVPDEPVGAQGSLAGLTLILIVTIVPNVLLEHAR